MPVGHGLAARERVELGEAAHEDWIATRHDNDTYALLAVACAAAGFSPRIAHAAKEWFAVSALVAAGLGVCIVPRIVPLPAEHHVVRIPLRGSAAQSRRFITDVRRGSSQHPAIHAGLTVLRTAARTRTQDGQSPAAQN